jgi:hypothetical protein
MNMAVFWIVAPCRMVETYEGYTHHPHDRGNKRLRNSGKLLPEYTP